MVEIERLNHRKPSTAYTNVYVQIWLGDGTEIINDASKSANKAELNGGKKSIPSLLLRCDIQNAQGL